MVTASEHFTVGEWSAIITAFFSVFFTIMGGLWKINRDAERRYTKIRSDIRELSAQHVHTNEKIEDNEDRHKEMHETFWRVHNADVEKLHTVENGHGGRLSRLEGQFSDFLKHFRRDHNHGESHS